MSVHISYEHTKKFINHFGYPLYRDFEQESHGLRLMTANYAGIPTDIEAFVGFTYDKNQGDVKPVAFIAFRHEEWNDSFYIYGSYTDPEFRRQGINAKLFQNLLINARERNIGRIDSNVSMHNKAMQSAMEKQGRKATSINYTYYVAPWIEKAERPPVKKALLDTISSYENSVVVGIKEMAGRNPYYVVKYKYDRHDSPVEKEHGDRVVFYSTNGDVLAVIGLSRYPNDDEMVRIPENMSFFKERTRHQWILEG